MEWDYGAALGSRGAVTHLTQSRRQAHWPPDGHATPVLAQVGRLQVSALPGLGHGLSPRVSPGPGSACSPAAGPGSGGHQPEDPRPGPDLRPLASEATPMGCSVLWSRAPGESDGGAPGGRKDTMFIPSPSQSPGLTLMHQTAAFQPEAGGPGPHVAGGRAHRALPTTPHQQAGNSCLPSAPLSSGNGQVVPWPQPPRHDWPSRGLPPPAQP